MAAPLVSGQAALVQAAHPGIHLDKLTQALTNSASALPKHAGEVRLDQHPREHRLGGRPPLTSVLRHDGPTRQIWHSRSASRSVLAAAGQVTPF